VKKQMVLYDDHDARNSWLDLAPPTISRIAVPPGGRAGAPATGATAITS